jgi:hypothetical protein
MNIIQNENVAFRCPNTLKEKLQKYAEENDLRVSAVIRTACVEWLRYQNQLDFPSQKLFQNLKGT